jgi:hypothetical protein
VRIVRIALILAVAGLTLMSVRSGRVDPAVVLVVSASTAASIVALVSAITSRRRLEASIARVRSAIPVVVEQSVEPPQDDVAEEMTRVRALGFDLAGATDTTVGRRTIRTWVLVESTGETWVELGRTFIPIAIFLSDVRSDVGPRFVETAFPTGEPIDDPSLLSQVVGDSEEAALTAHRAGVAQAGGAVRRVRTIDDYLAAEADHRERTGGMRIAAYLERVVRPSILEWAVSLVVDVVALAVLLAVTVRVDR